MFQLVDCIDAGSEYCPCYLAETNDCIICSQLQGKTFCDCRNWKGVCIYQEYAWNGQSKKEGRTGFVCSVVEHEQITEAVVLFTLEVTKTLARELQQPGSYVFLRAEGEPTYFDTPLSILEADVSRGLIKTAFEVRGTKTKALHELSENVMLRGPYWNGVLGLKYIKGLRNNRALLIVRGIGQVPAVAVAQKLRQAGNAVDVILDKGRTGLSLAEPYFAEAGCKVSFHNVYEGNSRILSPDIKNILAGLIREDGTKFVFSGGSDLLHQGLVKHLSGLGTETFFACSNNNRLCCGEGVCGSCQTRLSDGKRIKTCKTQINPMNIF